MNRRTTATERRRAQLALRFASLEPLEPRNLATESLGVLTAGIGVAAAAMVARPEAQAPTLDRSTSTPSPLSPWSASVRPRNESARPQPAPQLSVPIVIPTVGDLPTLPGVQPNQISISRGEVATTSGQAGGGSLGGTHGGSGNIDPTPSRQYAPITATAFAPYVGFPSVVGTSTLGRPADSLAGPLAESGTPNKGSPSLPSSREFGGDEAAMASFSFSQFPVYTLDYNAGSVLLPGSDRLATLGGDVDLRAQVRDVSVASYSWDTSGLTEANSITGTSSDRLQFQWNTWVGSATTNSVSLTVTDTNNHTETQTYTYQVPAGYSSSSGTGTANWPESFAPDHQGDAGASSAAIALPGYNANVPAVVLSYSSLAADPRPIIQESHLLDPTLAVPTTVTAQLTFNGTVGSAYSYDTSQLNAGAVQKIALQADATALPTGRYGYSIALGDVRGTTTTSTASGMATVINYAGAAFGAGWSLAGLERIVPTSGGAILDLGTGAESRWFASGSGATYVSPAGEFSTLVQNGDGSYTRTLTDGTVIQFDAGGHEMTP